jgi:hypothetical protein
MRDSNETGEELIEARTRDVSGDQFYYNHA